MGGKITATILASLFFANFALAQTGPEIWATWRADSFVPPFYGGKQLPTRNTNMEVRFELIDGGRVVNLSQTEIRWYLNEKLIQKGIGLKTFAYQIGRNSSRDSIRINIPNYSGGELNRFIDLPIQAPEAVLVGAFPYFLAFPYFFNVKNLDNFSFQWNVNNLIAPTDTEFIFNLDLSSLENSYSFTAAIGVNIQNRLVAEETASDLINFKY